MLMEYSNITYKNKILYRITFKKSFFKSIENVENVFKNKFNFLELKENKNIIIGRIYNLFKSKKNKEKILKRYDENYNKFVKLYYIDIEITEKIE